MCACVVSPPLQEATPCSRNGGYTTWRLNSTTIAGRAIIWGGARRNEVGEGERSKLATRAQ